MKNNLHHKGKIASRKVTIQATGVNLTSQAGLLPVSKFWEAHNISEIIKNETQINRAKHSCIN